MNIRTTGSLTPAIAAMPVRLSHARVVVGVLAAVAAIGQVSTTIYLPSIPALSASLATSENLVQLTIVDLSRSVCAVPASCRSGGGQSRAAHHACRGDGALHPGHCTRGTLVGHRDRVRRPLPAGRRRLSRLYHIQGGGARPVRGGTVDPCHRGYRPCVCTGSGLHAACRRICQ